MSGLYGNATGGFCNPQTYILTDENGKEITGVLVENVTVFDATTTRFRWQAIGTDGDSNVGYVIYVHAIGRWK